MKKKIMIICLAVLIAAGGTIAFSGEDEVCGCGCGHPVVEGMTHCGCGWEPAQV